MKDYKFKSLEQIATELSSLPLGTSIDFTFNSIEEAEDKNFMPFDWYGMQLVAMFDPVSPAIVFGQWGFGALKAVTINTTQDIVHAITKFCKDEIGCEVEYLCVSNLYNGN
jgi:hypothetical protein